MTNKYSVAQYSVDNILGFINSGEISIPEIQRPFVWNPSKVRDLIDSLYSGYPTGYLIIWQNPTVRLKDGKEAGGTKILIDGQQRVTALMTALAGQKILTEDSKQKQIDELIAKIKALTPQKNIISLDTDIAAIMETEGFAVRQYSKIKIDTKILETLRNSLLAFKKIKFNYLIDNSPKEITLNPYGIIISDKYYLVGYNEYVKGLRLYKIDKMNEVKILDEYYETDENFSLQEYCNNSFGIYQEEPIDVVLEFDKSVKEDVLNYHFHPTQKIKELKNGNIQLKFTSGGKKAICYELFKWGNNVQIKSPKELKLFYKELLEAPLKYLK